MTLKRGKFATQGKFDGLCGLYGLVNAIRHSEMFDDAEDRDSLRYLLEAAERLNLLSSHVIMNGYEAHQLIDIFNEFARAHRYPARAYHLKQLAETLPDWSPACRAKRVFEQFGQMVVPVDEGNHWVLAFGYDFSDVKPSPAFLVEDPDHTSNRPRIALSEVFAECEHGVLILPTSSAIKLDN